MTKGIATYNKKVADHTAVIEKLGARLQKAAEKKIGVALEVADADA